MIHILLDTKEGYPFIEQRLTLPCRVHYSPVGRRKYVTWLRGAWQVMRKARSGDVVLAVYDFQGVLCWLFGVLTLRRRHVVGINLLLKDKNTMKNRLASWLYKKAVTSPWFHTTVTTRAYGEWFNSKLGTNIDLPVLRDVYYDDYEPSVEPMEGDGTVFCGGRNSRDWDLMVRIAQKMPDVSFRFVMPTDKYNDLVDTIPANVEAVHEVSMERFVELMNRSSMIAMPVVTDAPAGLITMFQAAGFEKPILSTRTVSTGEYLTESRGYPIEGSDVDIWANTIRYVLAHPDEASEKAAEFHRFVKSDCSEEEYVNTIEQILTKIL